MSVLLKCSSKRHTIRLDPARFWKKTICPKCKVAVDPLRVRRFIKWLPLVFKSRSKATPVPDEFRFANLRWRIDELAGKAWKSEESLRTTFSLQPSRLGGTSPEKTIEAILNHVSL